MKKMAAGFALASAISFIALTAAPASAAPFSSCAEANAAGYSNIPSTSPLYSANLDRDGDGIACDDNGQRNPQNNESVSGQQSNVQQPDGQQPGTVPGQQQVQQIPTGGAETGVTPQKSDRVQGGEIGLISGGAIASIAIVAGLREVRRHRRDAGADSH